MNQAEWTEAADAALARVEGLTDREAGERLDISFSTIQRWRKLRASGREIPEPRGAPRAVLLRFAAQRADSGQGRMRENGREERPEDVGHRGEAEELFEDFDRIVRFLRKVGPPGEGTKRKEAAVRALYDMLANTGGVPEWWYRLRDQLEAGEL